MKSLRKSLLLAIITLAPMLPNVAQARCICECQADRAINSLLKGIHEQSYNDFSNVDLESQSDSLDPNGKTITKYFKFTANYYQGDRPVDMAQQAPQEWEVVAHSKKESDAGDCEIVSIHKIRDLAPTDGKPQQK